MHPTRVIAIIYSVTDYAFHEKQNLYYNEEKPNQWMSVLLVLTSP